MIFSSLILIIQTIALINRLFPERYFFSIIYLCNRSSFIAGSNRNGYLLQTRKNNVPEITDILRYLPMVEKFGGKALHAVWFKHDSFKYNIAYV